MIRTFLTTLVLALAAQVWGTADTTARSGMPGWQTDPATCAWHWREGGGIGLWAETCVFTGVTWQVVWDADRAAFVTRSGEAVMGVAVESLTVPPGSDIAALSQALKDTLAATGLKMPQVAIPLRVALLGQPQSPAIDAVLEVLGRDAVLQRLDAVL